MSQLPYSVEETISLKVLERLESIRTSKGYRHDAKARRLDSSDMVEPTFEDRLILLLEGDKSPDGERPQGGEQWTKRYAAVCYIRVSENADTPLDQRATLIAADVEKAVCEDRFWDNYASNTFLDGTERAMALAEDFYTVVVNFTVQFRHVEDDPYTLL
jgi:hypothetical protein